MLGEPFYRYQPLSDGNGPQSAFIWIFAQEPQRLEGSSLPPFAVRRSANLKGGHTHHLLCWSQQWQKRNIDLGTIPIHLLANTIVIIIVYQPMMQL
jgi:hypothetical protein